MISIDHRHHHLAAIRSALSVMIYPVQYAVNAPIQLFTKVSGSLSTHQALARENEQLRLDNFALRSRAQKYNALARENQRLRELLDSSSELNETVVGADVLAIDTAPASRQIVINKGARHGVSVGQPVVDAHGVAGANHSGEPVFQHGAIDYRRLARDSRADKSHWSAGYIYWHARRRYLEFIVRADKRRY